MDQKQENLSYDQVISLLSIYESEWEHRNNILWTQTFRFFYLSIFIMVLPNITEYLSITLPDIPIIFFPIIGIITSTLSFFLSISYSKRLEASSETYKNINNLLPYKYRRVKLKNIKYGKYFIRRQTVIIPVIIYIISLVIGSILIIK